MINLSEYRSGITANNMGFKEVIHRPWHKEKVEAVVLIKIQEVNDVVVWRFTLKKNIMIIL